MDVTTDRWFTFAVPPHVVRAALGETARYPQWWPWLSEFAADGLFPGARWTCAVRSPLRTMLRFRLLIDRVEDTIVEARLTGDLVGAARISLEPASGGAETALRFEARVRPRAAPVVVLTRVLPPVAQWSHDRIVEIGARQFASALAPTPG